MTTEESVSMSSLDEPHTQVETTTSETVGMNNVRDEMLLDDGFVQQEEEPLEMSPEEMAKAYEEERLRKIERNKQRLAALGLTNQKIGAVDNGMTSPNSVKRKYTKRKKNIPTEKRSSERLKNKEQSSTPSDNNANTSLNDDDDVHDERRKSMSDSILGRRRRGFSALTKEQQREEVLERMRKRPRRSFSAFVKPKKDRLGVNEPIYIEWQGRKYVTRQGLAIHSGADTRNTTHPLKFDRYKTIRNTTEEPFINVDVDYIDDLQQQYPGITVWHFKGNVMRLYTIEYADFLKEFYGYGEDGESTSTSTSTSSSTSTDPTTSSQTTTELKTESTDSSEVQPAENNDVEMTEATSTDAPTTKSDVAATESTSETQPTTPVKKTPTKKNKRKTPASKAKQPTTPRTNPRRSTPRTPKSAPPALSTSRATRSANRKKEKEDAFVWSSDLQKRMNEIYNTILLLENKDFGHQTAELFINLPSKRLYPDYYQIIKNPISLSMIHKRIMNEEYSSLDDMRSDVSLLVSNAQTYNQDGSVVFNDSVEIMNTFLKEAGDDLNDAVKEEENDDTTAEGSSLSSSEPQPIKEEAAEEEVSEE